MRHGFAVYSGSRSSLPSFFYLKCEPGADCQLRWGCIPRALRCRGAYSEPKHSRPCGRPRAPRPGSISHPLQEGTHCRRRSSASREIAAETPTCCSRPRVSLPCCGDDPQNSVVSSCAKAYRAGQEMRPRRDAQKKPSEPLPIPELWWSLVPSPRGCKPHPQVPWAPCFRGPIHLSWGIQRSTFPQHECNPKNLPL